MASSSHSFDVVVLGAGVVGINTAYWLARSGKNVCVVDRQPAAGLETASPMVARYRSATQSRGPIRQRR
jgi:glycine/D-amino acid oxidase-like deaminating enzyme